jgi:hypothetical protein
MKRWIVAAGAALATIAAAAVVAPAAQAGIDTPRILLGNVNGRCVLSSGADEVTVTGNPGDSFRVFNLGCGSAGVLLSGGAVSGPASIPNLTSATFTLAAQPTTGTLFVQPANTLDFLITVNVVSSPITTPTVQSHDYLQQVGLPSSGSCTDVGHDVGHWDGFPLGGWTKSWAMWIYNGTGGPVCTRELYFDNSQGEWRYVGQQ